ncbi:TetR/AcrR family transcriptional regulator [Paenibacillus borealis]|uniref:TetR family transcriptional regulator n=1 Tax=Paenibacillus borealis TaxID=160799 RepID=A0A089LAY2_PAEBO|nr:TetR/AcrR family transcriptional regulator [Paenibacillus borealis]AIQ58666.1 TetR family transcriptional regulator [Paenibacillus borealis]
MDRRIQKSKQAIMDAFLALMSETDIENITVNKIAELANVNRGTVYLHFLDKYDLLDHCLEEQINRLIDKCAPDSEVTGKFTSKSTLLRVFEYLEQNSGLYSKMLRNRGVPAFRNRLLVVVRESLSRQFDLIASGPNFNKEITVQFLASAVISSFEWWISNSMPYPASVMAEQIWALLDRTMISLPLPNQNSRSVI